MAGRFKIKEKTTDSRTYKYMHQSRIFYFETNRWVYKQALKNWKYYRKKQYKNN